MPRDFLSGDLQDIPVKNNPAMDFLSSENMPKEDLKLSLAYAPGRIVTDIAKGLYEFGQNIPKNYQKAKTELPGLYGAIREHPLHVLKQAGAGFAEMGKEAFNFPHDIANYSDERLHLLPEEINKKIQMGRMPADTEQMINETFGKPQYPGDELARGITRNLMNVAGMDKVVGLLNPLQYRSAAIAKNIVKARDEAKELYNKKYDSFLDKANKADIGHTLPQTINNIDFDTALTNEPKKSLARIEEFKNNPNIITAHDAKKDLLKIQRKLINKHESQGLIGNEPAQLDAVTNAIGKIENNMFTDKNGIINPKFANQYRKIQQGYAQDVIPYTQNKAINEFRRGDLLAKELIPRLRKGKFAARKGEEHPELFRPTQIRNAILGLSGVGIGGQLLGNYLSSLYTK